MCCLYVYLDVYTFQWVSIYSNQSLTDIPYIVTDIPKCLFIYKLKLETNIFMSANQLVRIHLGYTYFIHARAWQDWAEQNSYV